MMPTSADGVSGERTVSGLHQLPNGRYRFVEQHPICQGFALCVDVDQVLHRESTQFQEILVFGSPRFGRVLVLDNAIQVTEKDEAAYQEAMAHLALSAHRNPLDVAVIGGGDGGVVRELVKHCRLRSITLCEIDIRVVEACRQYLPFMTTGLDDPRVTVHIGDGCRFLEERPNAFDVIITDSSDPAGPATALFQRDFYETMKRSLRPGGVICCQGESIWFEMDLICEILGFCRDLFPVVDYASIQVPSYLGGNIGFILCSLDTDANFSRPVNPVSDADVATMNLKFYNRDVHKSAFVLPNFAQDRISACLRKNR